VCDYPVTREFDADSLIVSSPHVGVLRQGLAWHPSQMPLGALTTSMHMKPLMVRYEDEHGHLHQRRVPLHDVPNYCFGRLPGAEGFTVHWLFPQLYQPSTFTVAEKSLRSNWTDRILLPSLDECLPPGRAQHNPGSFKHAQANARALFTETRTTAVTADAHHQNLQYEIPPDWVSSNPRLTLDIDISPRLIAPHPYTNQNTVAVACGPIIYCVEDVDNSWVRDHFRSVQLDPHPKIQEQPVTDSQTGDSYVALTIVKGASILKSENIDASPEVEVRDLERKLRNDVNIIKELHLVPYFFRANRQGRGHMRVGLRRSILV
jgi:hypothetical protein